MKKTKLYISFFLIFSVIAFSVFTGTRLFEPEKPALMPQGTPSYKFIIGAMHNSVGPDPGYYTFLDQLHMNLWHRYLGQDTYNGRDVPIGWTGNDNLMNPLTEYQGDVGGILQTTYSHNQMRTLMQRPKIEWLCRGQRSDYRCVDTSYLENKDLWFYTFQSPNHVGRDDTDNTYLNGKYVRHCRTENSTNQGSWFDNPGMVVSRLRSNTEQCNPSGSGNQWFGDSQCDWYIKPRIRIDSNFAHTNPETPVCSIKVIAQDDVTVLKETIIKAKYFLVDGTPQQYYDGRYIEEYNFSVDPVNLTIQQQDWLGTDTEGKWQYKARGEHNPDNSWENHADIQVWWYGSCDMWIDYVRVDNDIADGLLGTSNSSYGMYDQWLKDAAASGYINIMAVNPAEFELNNLPCLKYVEKKMKEYSGGRFKIVAEK